MSNRYSKLAIVTATLLLAATFIPASAHHSVAAEYGNAPRVYFEGDVSELYWVPPHVRIRAVATEGGDIPPGDTWDLTTHPPGILARNYDFPPGSVEVGDHIRVYGRASQFGLPRFAIFSMSVNGGEEKILSPTADDRVAR